MLSGRRRSTLLGGGSALVGGWLLYRNRKRRNAAGAAPDTVTVEDVITIGKPADELHRLWRDPQTHSRIMGDFAEVTSIGEDRQHWEVDVPLGRSVAWDAEVVEDRPGELLRWESLDGADLPNEGSVRFHPAPSDRGTKVSLQFRFDPPGGALGTTAVERLDIVPSTLATRALRRFKSLAETGEIPTLEKNPSARGTGDLV